jgi:lambda repressor-like predicted transcriptional regulator
VAPPGADPDPVREFCREFGAELDARGVSLRKAAEQSGWSKSAIANARGGAGLPREQLVVDVLTAIGLDAGEVESWRERHRALADGRAAATAPPAPEPTAPPPAAPEPPRRRVGRGVLLAAAVVAAVCLAAVVVAFSLPDGSTGARADAAPVAAAVVTVQNKVALGATELVEDTSPAYLSAEPVAYCSRRGCRMEGTDVASGALLVAVCHVRGERMWNYNLDSPAADNPHRAASDLWYRLAWPDGRRGYLSEVYLDPASRGGLGLPQCGP